MWETILEVVMGGGNYSGKIREGRGEMGSGKGGKGERRRGDGKDISDE